MGLIDMKVKSALQHSAAQSTISEGGSKVALIKTMKCPRCGAKLHYRDAFNDSGGISKEVAELYDIYGHSFPIFIIDFIKAREGKQ